MSFHEEIIVVDPSMESLTMWVDRELIEDANGHVGYYTGNMLVYKQLPHGNGFMQYLDAGRSYDGEWKQGRRHGRGGATFEGGDTYQGMYANDKRQGVIRELVDCEYKSLASEF